MNSILLSELITYLVITFDGVSLVSGNPHSLFLFHVGVLNVSEWHEGLFDGLGGGKLEHVGRTAGLVIGS